MGKFVNIHTHSPNSENIEVINQFVQNNWKPQSNYFYSLGLHPWHISDFEIDLEIEKLKRLAGNPQIVAIGECGLDRAIETPLEKQEEVFRKQIEITESVNKPLIIHSVKSYPDLIRIKKSTKSHIPWILHGYSGNKQTTDQLLSHDFYFSFSTIILKNQAKLIESLKIIPLNKLFFETDESSGQIETIYTFAAKTLQLPLEELKAKIFKNFKSVFNYG